MHVWNNSPKETWVKEEPQEKFWKDFKQIISKENNLSTANIENRERAESNVNTAKGDQSKCPTYWANPKESCRKKKKKSRELNFFF